MKKAKILSSLSFTLLFSSICFSLLSNFSSLEANALDQKNVELFDDFSSGQFSNDWVTKGDAKLTNDRKTLILDCKNVDMFTSNLYYKMYKINKSCDLYLSYIPTNINENSVFAIDFGSQNSGTTFGFTGAALTSGSTYTHFWDGSSGILSVDVSKMTYVSTINSTFEKQEMTVKYSFTKKAIDKYDIGYTVFDEENNPVWDEIVYKDVNFNDNSYFGFIADYITLNFTSLKIIDSDGEHCEDFNNSSILYPSGGGDDNSSWAVAYGLDSSVIKIGYISKVDLTKINSEIIYDNKFKFDEQNQLETLYSLSYEIDLSTLKNEVYTGIEIGKTDYDSKGTFVGFGKSDNSYFAVSYSGIKESKYDVNLFGNSSVQVNINVNYDHKVVMTFLSYSFEFDYKDANGYFSFVSRDHFNLSEESSGGLIDNVSYVVYTFSKAYSLDKSINFNGTISSIYDGQEQFDTWYSKNDWYASADVRQPSYSYNRVDSYIGFNTLGNLNSAFGPKYIYNNFIVTFDITIDNHCYGGEQFGLQFGKDQLDIQYQNAKSVGFQNSSYNNRVTTMLCATHCKDVDGLETKAVGETIFKKGERYSFMYIVLNHQLMVFYKNANDKNATFGNPVGVFKNLETTGYVAVYGCNNIRFNLDNFSIRNLDIQYRNSPRNNSARGLETVRYDFSVAKEISEFTLERAKIKKNLLKFKRNSYIEAKYLQGSHLLRFETGKASNFVYKFGNTNVIFSKNSIELIDNMHRHVKYFDNVDFSNSIIQIMNLDSKITISFISKNDPYMAINRNEISFDISKSTKNFIKIEAVDEMELSQMSIFNLDNSTFIPTVDFDPNVDSFNPWPIKPTA